MSNPADDLRIAAAVDDTDSAAEAEFDRKYRNRLRYLASRAGIPPQDAEDVAQEALVSAVSQLRRGLFRGDSSLGTWLTAILQRRIADYWRRMGRTPGGTITRFARTSDPSDDVLDTLAAGQSDLDIVLSVRQILERLPALHRTVLILNQFDQYTTKEIAARLGRRPGTVGRILAESKELFRASARAMVEENRRDLRLKKGEAL